MLHNKSLGNNYVYKALAVATCYLKDAIIICNIELFLNQNVI